MAEEPTFQGVIERLKAEGLLDRNSGANSIKSLKEINLKGFTLLSYQMEELIDFFKGNALQDEENRRELLQALKGGKKEEKKEGKKKDGGFEMDNLGDLAGTFLAAITGLLAGFVVGLTQNFLLVLKLLGKGLNNLFLKPILNFIKRTKVFRLFRANLFIFTKRIKGLTTGISSFCKKFKGISTLPSKFIYIYKKNQSFY